MRYTLRLLTTQQFQRAMRLIMALDQIRKWDTYNLGDDENPITIGLYVGSNSLPNSETDLREEVNKQEVLIKILEKLDINNESNINITLFQGLPKATKMDLIVQKCVELGISKIVPTITHRVDIKLKGEFKKLDRLNKIAQEASKQSKRTIIPKVESPIEFNEALKEMENLDLITTI